ncbi:AMIN-like domain-containing (lipo)protein [Blastococcus xanthinilyticus]|uniref:AMIN-like domain-containing protein n=1 Tax=Blastococcus xanthinilyticus TaxID=1564164 RepID=A0A5S5CVQ3_9ACTN|nr:hypothetical protein [Blastococcus xanthinilyticus]TYP87870.1 hypothetical protein BD833_10541 [Blastococcus xanthinilyticus]
MRATSRVVPALLISSVLLVGCAGTGDVEPAAGTAASSPSTTPPPAEPEETAPSETAGALPFDANTEPDTQEPSADARLTVSDIRITGEDGFDRVVLDLGGEGTPGWDVRYVDSASAPGSGQAVDVAGNAVLQLELTGAGYPYDTGVEEYSGPVPLTSADTSTVTEVVFQATYEGTTTAFVGAQERAPFRVYAEENPARVVIEVAHAG